MTSLLIFTIANVMAAASGAIFQPGEWYERLAKPDWVPPNWAFPVVWSIIFALNILAGWLVWQAAGEGAWLGLLLYALNLVLNALWSALFFGQRRMDRALLDAGLLVASVLAVMIAFATHSVLAAALLTPYLAWTSIAFLLNWKMIELNPAPGHPSQL